MKRSDFFRRATAVLLAALLAVGSLVASVGAAEPIAPYCDETYYATLDYYGGLMESSVVKSYETHGNAKITDYGVYSSVTNLNDNRAATVADGKVEFDLTGDVPTHFYFEGKTEQPYTDFPWTLSLSYKMNGVPMAAEDLAGKCGTAEITLDALPNTAASEYNRNNLVLIAASAFNGDDILSLEAPGAQVQLIGNLRVVLYAVLPGEEQHFTMRVGSDSFTYSGMMFLAVPATLAQLDQVADLKEAKDKVEDAYNAISDSMDVILDTLESMSGSMSETASGLDRLNGARETVSAGKDKVYTDLDAALDAAGTLTASMQPMSTHLDTLSSALDDLDALYDDTNAKLQKLRPELETARTAVKELRALSDEVRDILDELDGTTEDALDFTEQLLNNMVEIQEILPKLHDNLHSLRRALESMQGLSGLDEITVDGKTPDEIRELAAAATAAHNQYLGYLAANGIPESALSFEQFLVAAGKTPEQAEQINDLYESAQDPTFDDQLDQADSINKIISTVNGKITEISSAIAAIAAPSAKLIRNLEDMTELLDGEDEDGISAQLIGLVNLADDILIELDEHPDMLADFLDTADKLGDSLTRLTEVGDALLDEMDAFDAILAKYEPDAKQAIADAKAFTTAASDGIDGLASAARTAESLLKDSGDALNAGTKSTLDGLSALLRRGVVGLNQTGTIRSAKNTLTDLIDDEWNSHAGEDNNVLLMDANAAPVSMTDARNANTTSIQFVMRTQEIKEGDAAKEEQTQEETAKTTFWQRVAAMFVDLWNFIKGIFSGKKD